MITLVSCFYPLSGNKSSKNYLELGQHLMNCTLPLVFYSDDPQIIEWVNTKRGTLPTYLRLLPLEESLFFQDKTLLKERYETFSIANLNKEKDTVDYILLQASKMHFLEKAIEANPFQSSFFFWIDFGIQHCAQASAGDWIQMEKDLEACVNNFPDKIHHLKVWPVQKLPHQTWKTFFQNIYHHVAGGLFGGSTDSLLFYIEQFQKLWKDILEDGWYQLDEALFTILTEKFPEKFRFWYGDYDGIIKNIKVSVVSLPLIFKNIQLHLDARDYREANKLLKTVQPNSDTDLFRFVELFIQNDFYLNDGLLSDALYDLLCQKSFPEEFLHRQTPNLLYYKKDARLNELFLRSFSNSSLQKWERFKGKGPKLIYMNQSKEFPFLQFHHTNLIASFRKQFLPSKDPRICEFYSLLESPVLPLVFLWTHIPPEKDLIELCGYLERNYKPLDFVFVYLIPNVSQAHHERLLPFLFPVSQQEEEAKLINAWMKILFS